MTTTKLPFLAILAAGSSLAATPPSTPPQGPAGACLESRQFAGEVRSCADNARVLATGRSCYNLLQEKWQANSPTAQAKKTGTQSKEMNLAGQDFRSAEKQLKLLITFTKKNTKVLSQYRNILRQPAGAGKPPPCYTQPKKELKLLVKALRKKIKEGKQARKELKRMRKIAKARAKELGATAAVNKNEFKQLARSKGIGAPSEEAAKVKRKISSSTITGSESINDPQNFMQSFFEK